jgi:hypothetical protein
MRGIAKHEDLIRILFLTPTATYSVAVLFFLGSYPRMPDLTYSSWLILAILQQAPHQLQICSISNPRAIAPIRRLYAMVIQGLCKVLCEWSPPLLGLRASAVIMAYRMQKVSTVLLPGHQNLREDCTVLNSKPGRGVVGYGILELCDMR